MNKVQCLEPEGNVFIPYVGYCYFTNARVADINTNNILFLNNQVTAINEWINTLPDISDLSGYYTKDEVDSLLATKADVISVEELRTSLDEVANNVNQNTEDIATKASQADLDKLRSDAELSVEILQDQIDPLVEDVTDINESLSIMDGRIGANEVDISTLMSQDDYLDSKINANTSSINTLNTLVEQSFETLGTYHSNAGSMTTEEVRPIIFEDTAMDPEYVEVRLSPDTNLFTNKANGRIVFNVTFDKLINDENEKIVSINIYQGDNVLLKQIPKQVEANFNGTINLINGVEVSEGSEVYFTFKVTSGTGTISVDNQIVYNIEYTSKSVTSNKASLIINDSNVEPELGINPQLLKADKNTTDIANLQANFEALQSEVVALYNQVHNDYALPVNTIIIGTQAPGYGTWTYLGTLGEGQTIIGGSSSNGNVISHNHMWQNYGSTYQAGNNGGTRKVVAAIQTFNADGSTFSMSDLGNKDFGDGYTLATGTDKNYAYGLGIGTMNIYRRDA